MDPGTGQVRFLKMDHKCYLLFEYPLTFYKRGHIFYRHISDSNFRQEHLHTLFLIDKTGPLLSLTSVIRYVSTEIFIFF